MSETYTHIQNVRVTAKQKAIIDRRGGSNYVRDIVELMEHVQDSHFEFLNSKGGSAYLRELIEWDIECARKAEETK